MIIKTSSIKVERADADTKRFRKDFGDIQALVASIKKHGLIHPIVVSKIDLPKLETLNDAMNQQEWILIAGERRLTATLYLGQSTIKAVELKDIDDVQRKEIELEENIMRKDVSWAEQATATMQLDELKRKQYGSRLQGSSENTGWTQKDTAKAIGSSIATVSQDIKLAKAIEEDSALRKKVSGMTKVVARKYIEREKQTKRMKLQIEKHQIVLSSNLIHGRCEEEIKNLADESVNCLITDPPWGVADITAVAEGNLSGKYNQEGKNVGDEDEMRETYKVLIPELARVMAPGAHIYMFFAPDWYWILGGLFRQYGFSIDAVPLIWPKHRTTMIPNPYHYIPSYEMILFGCKKPKQRTLVKPRPNCLLDYPADAPTKRVHPLQKPFNLISMMIANSTIVGETVLDCFAGSAVVLRAASKLGRRGIGFEADEKNFFIAQEYLLKEK